MSIRRPKAAKSHQSVIQQRPYDDARPKDQEWGLTGKNQEEQRSRHRFLDYLRGTSWAPKCPEKSQRKKAQDHSQVVPPVVVERQLAHWRRRPTIIRSTPNKREVVENERSSCRGRSHRCLRCLGGRDYISVGKRVA